MRKRCGSRYEDLLWKADVLEAAARRNTKRGNLSMALVFKTKAQELADQAQDLTVAEAMMPADEGELRAAQLRNATGMIAKAFASGLGIPLELVTGGAR